MRQINIFTRDILTYTLLLILVRNCLAIYVIIFDAWHNYDQVRSCITVYCME